MFKYKSRKIWLFKLTYGRPFYCRLPSELQHSVILFADLPYAQEPPIKGGSIFSPMSIRDSVGRG